VHSEKGANIPAKTTRRSNSATEVAASYLPTGNKNFLTITLQF